MANNGKKILTVGALALLLLFGTGASAKEPPKNPPKDQEAPPPDNDQVPPPNNDNWGVTPPGLRDLFSKAEQASKIPGLGRFMAVWSWGAYRAMQPFVSLEEAAAIAAAKIDLCRVCRNQNDAAASRKALERVTLPKSQGGAYDKPWPKPDQFDQWADFGSAGLFDLLAGAVVHLGIHEGYLSPLLSLPPNTLYQPKVQAYLGGVLVHRILNSPLYPVLQGNPAATWSRVRAVTASPDQFVGWSKKPDSYPYINDVISRFQGRAAELGIDLSKVANPKLSDVKAWPGAQAYWQALEVGL